MWAESANVTGEIVRYPNTLVWPGGHLPYQGGLDENDIENDMWWIMYVVSVLVVLLVIVGARGFVYYRRVRGLGLCYLSVGWTVHAFVQHLVSRRAKIVSEAQMAAGRAFMANMTHDLR